MEDRERRGLVPSNAIKGCLEVDRRNGREQEEEEGGGWGPTFAAMVRPFPVAVTAVLIAFPVALAAVLRPLAVAFAAVLRPLPTYKKHREPKVQMSNIRIANKAVRSAICADGVVSKGTTS